MTARTVDLATMEKALAALEEGEAVMRWVEEEIEAAAAEGTDTSSVRAALSEAQLRYLELCWWVDGGAM